MQKRKLSFKKMGKKKNLGFGAMAFIGLAIFAASFKQANSEEAIAGTRIEKVLAVKSASVDEKVSGKQLLDQYITGLYNSANLAVSGLDFDVFQKAMTGFLNLKNKGAVSAEKNILTIVDFNQVSSKKRMWILDVAANKLLFNTLVAHGRGSGGDKATAFSNTNESHQSSLGFYLTNETYFGKHGLSLRLDGLDAGQNSNARARAIVVHGADYVSEGTVKALGRLGRSHGCPAIPQALTKPIIETIKGKTVMFINGPSEKYQSNLLDELSASSMVSRLFN